MDTNLPGKVLVYPVNILPELGVLRNHERGSVALLVEPEEPEAAADRGHHTDDDGRLGVPGHQTAVPVEESLQSTDDSILTAANWNRFFIFIFIFYF